MQIETIAVLKLGGWDDGPAPRRSRSADRPGPAVIEAAVDPNEPPMPPKATARQAAHLAEALGKGTPHAGKIALTIASDKVKEMV